MNQLLNHDNQSRKYDRFAYNSQSFIDTFVANQKSSCLNRFKTQKCRFLFLIIGMCGISFMIGFNYAFFTKGIYFSDIQSSKYQPPVQNHHPIRIVSNAGTNTFINLEGQPQRLQSAPIDRGSNCGDIPAKHKIIQTGDTKTYQRFLKRRKFLEDTCERLNIRPDCSPNQNTYWPIATNHMVVDLPNHLLGCLVQKAGSSSWHKIFWQLYAERLKTEHDKTISFEAGKAYGQNFYRSSLQNVGEKNYAMAGNDANYIRFLTARHPLARLYSGWNQNLRSDGPMAKSLFDQMNLRQFKTTNSSEHVIDWKDFLNFMAKTVNSNPNRINVHFRPITTKCGLCKRQLDYIIKSETSEDDNNYLLDIIKGKKFAEKNVPLPEIEKVEHRNTAVSSLSSKPELVGEMYKGLPNDIMTPILEYYKLDMELLNYGYNHAEGTITY